MNDIGEKGWNSVSAQVVLGRGNELDQPDSGQSCPWALKPGCALKAMHRRGSGSCWTDCLLLSTTQSFLQYGDGSWFLWLTSGKGIDLHQGHTGRNIELAKKFIWGFPEPIRYYGKPE